MNFYNFHMGDYMTATAHLTPIEDIAYRRLLDLYYQKEGEVSSDIKELARRIRLSGNETEVETVVREFFTIDDDKLCNSRADEEISMYLSRLRKNAEAGKASARQRMLTAAAKDGDKQATTPQRKQNARPTTAEQALNDRSSSVQPPKNQEPRTKNQEPDSPPPPPAELATTGVADVVLATLKEAQVFAKSSCKADRISQVILDFPTVPEDGWPQVARELRDQAENWAGAKRAATAGNPKDPASSLRRFLAEIVLPRMAEPVGGRKGRAGGTASITDVRSKLHAMFDEEDAS